MACPGAACDQTIIEQHRDFDLAYVEFTERGNLFKRARMDDVLNHVRDLAAAPEGVLAVVFVHGWKHNAAAGDANVESFRELLTRAAEITQSKRRIVGIYVGWRGQSVRPPVIEELSYWERKAVAEQVGKGGVTELLVKLERIVIDSRAPNKNLYLVTGHSFGGAIVLTALNEIILERIVAALPATGCQATPEANCACVESRPFGHGVVLLNPAIEANEAFQLKEVAARGCFGPNQVRLLHVISSDTDVATHEYFRVGQWLGMLNWREAELTRNLNAKEVPFAEAELDTIAVGNYTPFQTGQLCNGDLAQEDRRPECRLDGRPEGCLEASATGRWDYVSYVGNEACVPASDREQHIPVARNEPLAFIQTDEAFISDHNDVFTSGVSAYLATIAAEARFKRDRALGGSARDFPGGCVTSADRFDFGPCFDAYEAKFGGGR